MEFLYIFYLKWSDTAYTITAINDSYTETHNMFLIIKATIMTFRD